MSNDPTSDTHGKTQDIKPKNIRILCVGEAMLELSFDDTVNKDDGATVKYAGDTLNTAIYLQRLTQKSTTVTYYTRVGTDALSTRMINFIASESIDVSTIQSIDDRTIGLYAISILERQHYE